MDLKKVREIVRKDILKSRSIERIVSSSDFELAYTDSNEFYRDIVWYYIKRKDKVNLKKCIKERLTKLTPFHKMSVRQLRVAASHSNVYFYQTMNKVELIRELENVVTRLKEGSE